MIDNSVGLPDLFVWARRDRRFRVRLANGEYVMRAIVAGRDMGEPPHAVGSIVERIAGPDKFTPAVDLFVMLEDVLELTDPETGELVYRAA
jgi:hypothetical protein